MEMVWSDMKRISNLDIADCIYPASPLGGAVGLESIGCHCTLELVEVDENERAYKDNKVQDVSLSLTAVKSINRQII